MPKTDKKKIAVIIDEIEKKYGKGALYTIGSKYEQLQLPRVSTGIEDLDNVIGGGIPEGRIMEVYGAESAGKTTLCYYLLSRYSSGLFIDMEGTFDSSRAQMFGNRRGQLLVRRPSWGEQAFEIMVDFADAGIPLIVIDSVPAMIPRKEFEEEDMDKHAGIGMVAGIMSRKLPKLAYLCEKSGTTIIFINQVRDKIGGFAWGDPYTTPGGHALKHFASLRLQIAKKGSLDISGTRLGQICRVRVVKSKVCRPFMDCEIPLIYDKGFVLHESMKEELKEAMKRVKERDKQDA